MERRHILEGENRISRQEMIMSKLIWQGHDRLLPMAADVLGILREGLAMSWAHLRDLEEHLGEPPYHN